MKLLCTADLHYRLPQLDWLVEQAGDVDVVVIPGDHLQVVGAAPLEVQIVVVSKYLQRLSEQALVLASSGNHDLDGPGTTGEQATEWLQALASDRLVVDGQSTDVDGVRFTVCPWWDGPQTRQLVEDQLAGGRNRSSGPVDLGLSLAARRLAPVSGRLQGLPRSRPGCMDRPLAPRPRDLRPHPSGAVGGRWGMGRPSGVDMARQRRPPAGPDAGPRRHRSRRQAPRSGSHSLIENSFGWSSASLSSRGRACAPTPA